MSSNKYRRMKVKNDDGTEYYIMEHRYIMEQHLGRKLTKDEVVHHINANPLDNRIENLQVMSKGEHSRFHGKQFKGRIYKKKLDGEEAKISLRFSKELSEKIEKEAKQLGISKNSYIIMKLQDKLKK